MGWYTHRSDEGLAATPYHSNKHTYIFTLGVPLSSDPDSLEKGIIIGLEHLVWPENKEVLKKQRMWACRREEGANLKELLIARANFSNRINSVVLHNNPKRNTCIHMT